MTTFVAGRSFGLPLAFLIRLYREFRLDLHPLLGSSGTHLITKMRITVVTDSLRFTTSLIMLGINSQF